MKQPAARKFSTVKSFNIALDHPAPPRAAKPRPDPLFSVCDHAWSTGEEITFLKRIGSYGLYPESRQHHLRQYLKNMAVRSDWGDMNKGKIERWIQSELDAIKAGEREPEVAT